MAAQKITVDSLPVELKPEILSHLPLSDVHAASRANKSWNAEAKKTLERRGLSRNGTGRPATAVFDAIKTFNTVMSREIPTFTKDDEGELDDEARHEQLKGAYGQKYDALCTKIENTAKIRGVDASTLRFYDGRKIQDIVEDAVNGYLRHADDQWHPAVYRLLKALVSNSQTDYDDDNQQWRCWTEASSIRTQADLVLILEDNGPLTVAFPKQITLFTLGPRPGGKTITMPIRNVVAYAELKGWEIGDDGLKPEFAKCLAEITKEFFYSRDFTKETDPHVDFETLVQQAKRDPDVAWYKWPGNYSCVWDTANKYLKGKDPKDAFREMMKFFTTTGSGWHHREKGHYELKPTDIEHRAQPSLCCNIDSNGIKVFFTGVAESPTDVATLASRGNEMSPPEALNLVLLQWKQDVPAEHMKVNLALAFEAWYFARRSCVPQTVRIRSTFADLSLPRMV